MERKIVILPGTPNDDNRDYLPEAIKGSDMVVNENGNSSQVYPVRLKEYTDVVLDGVQATWYEYVPASYDGTARVPLVVSMHGGLMTGWGQAIYTSWTLVADREGFIVLFPNASRMRMWVLQMDEAAKRELMTPGEPPIPMNLPPDKPEDNFDMNYVLKLIDRMKQKYAIDEGRIFMQGMSMGNAMTSQFARQHGRVLAGKAGSGGPTYPGLLFDPAGALINRGGPLAVWQSRLENDSGGPPYYTGDTDSVVKINRRYWKTINQCVALPEIKIAGEDNLAFYRGLLADYVFRDVKNRDHGQTLDDAELIWDYLFSGTRRGADGRIMHTASNLPRRGDAYAIALADGKSQAYVHNKLIGLAGPVFKHQKLKYHGLNGGAIVRGEYFMAPVSFIASIYGAELSIQAGGLSCELTLPDGRTVQFARGSIGCVLDNKVCSMLCEAVFSAGELYIPIEWFCRRLFNNHVSACDGVLYITDHYAELSLNMAHLIRDEILAG
jgi:poly(3-hydroxybutyrate) depolymerase